MLIDCEFQSQMHVTQITTTTHRNQNLNLHMQVFKPKLLMGSASNRTEIVPCELSD